jgi:hypothetical protein
MSGLTNVLTASAPPAPARWLLRRVCTNNPFYVLSAGLFLAGLWASFEAQAGAAQTWALMTGLAGYTLLLAVTACLLVRFGNVWDDVRTVLLLVVLMFLATSVTFDEVVVLSPQRGLACSLGGLLFAVTLSEGLLRGTRLALPACYRVPYYLILALFFLYPLALGPLRGEPRDEALMWGLFAFSGVAGLVFLTLLPAVRRGAEGVRDNGSPWRWPLYPWVLFGLLALAVPGRAVLLCWSMQLLQGSDLDRVIFGLYFLVPFGLALAVLLLEAGLVPGRRAVAWVALAVPLGLVALAALGHRPDAVYQSFLSAFRQRLGGDPLHLTLLATAAFYGYAVLRGFAPAAEALTLTLAALAVVGPDALERGAPLLPPRPGFLLAAASVQLALGLRRRNAWRCLLGSCGAVAFAVLVLPDWARPFRVLVAFHLALATVLFVGAFDGVLGRVLRVTGGVLVLLDCTAATLGLVAVPAGLPPWLLAVYTPLLAALLAGYGLLLGNWPALGIATLAVVGWLADAGWRGYASLRQTVAGLDHIALSLGLFGLALLVSLAKSGVLPRWLRWAALGARAPRVIQDG